MSKSNAQKPSLAPIPAKLSAEWQDWLASNIVAGCTNDDMEKVMVDNGFSPTFSRSAIVVVRSMTERVQQQAPQVLSGYNHEPIRFSAGSVIRAYDRDVSIGFVMQNPNIAVVNDLLSAQECAELIEKSRGRLERSKVVNRDSGGQEFSNVRSSEGTHFQRGEFDICKKIEARIHALTSIPIDHGEPLQILHYGIGGEYLPHHDYFDPKDPGTKTVTAQGGQRLATMVIYLNTPQAGGSTEFPEVHLQVRPQAGSAVYFEYMNKEGQLDSRSLHAGLPVTEGEKWIATKWIRQRTY